MRPPHKGKPFRRLDAEPRRSPFSTKLRNALHVKATKSLASDCDPRAAREARCQHSPGCASGFNFHEGSFPVAEHGDATQGCTLLSKE
jgi:hypothetical protein